MKTLDQGAQKLKKICDILKNETIEPALKEAEAIIADAKKRAEEMISEAQKQVGKMHEEAKAAIEQERNMFQSSLAQASKLTIETLKQDITDKLFNREFHRLIEKEAADPKIIAKLIEAIIKAIDKEGLSANLSAVIPATVSEKEVTALLGLEVLNKLKEQSVTLGDFSGGAKVKMHDKNITVEITDRSLMELLAGYAPNFRKSLFAS